MENSQATCMTTPSGASQAPRQIAGGGAVEPSFEAAFDVIARFCAEQHYAFESAAWLRMASLSNGTLPVLARYLAGTSWYGHSEALEAFAQLADEQDDGILRSGGIDIARYSGAIRVHIARRRMPQQHAENQEEV